MITLALLLAAAQPTLTPTSAPTRIDLTADNTEITRSCTIRIAAGTIIEDADHNGILHIKADGVTIEFEKGSVLQGARINNNWNELKGFGIRIDGNKNVTIRNAELAGFKVALYATHADNLTLEHLSIHDGYRHRLKSTPEKEHNDDWMFPHNNDNREWMTNHGGAIVIERSKDCSLSNINVRTSQNGIILDRVTASKVYDNDCSFLSGWGLAMWRSSENIIARNAFDFCVRGHSEGVYNRGQDSAGILVFEQCSSNIFAENSATHSGDGFFGFAGREALGEVQPNPEDHKAKPFDPTSAGCNSNLIVNNDFSYAPAHGLEMTFSADNLILGNRFVENAICGIWGGYSRSTIIARNTFEGNGGMAYGLERGGVNIEHGSDNVIADNTFTNNRCAIHLWWDNDGKLLEKPLVKHNDKGASNNVIANNTFEINDAHPFTRDKDKNRPLIVLQLRDVVAKDQQPSHVNDNVYAGNTVTLSAANAKEFDVQAGIELLKPDHTPALHIPQIKLKLPGEKQPFGARPHLRGRDNIVMTEWGPWDHTGPDPRRRD